MTRFVWSVAAGALAVFVVATGYIRVTHASTSPPESSAPLVEIAAPYCGPMDVAFILDLTGSMGTARQNVIDGAASIVPAIVAASANDYQLALVTFKDDITVVEDLAPGNAAAATAAMTGLPSAFGGGDIPEASDEALNTVINALPASGRPQNVDFTGAFRAGAVKIIILVTDAVPGGFDDTYVPAVDGIVPPVGSAYLRAAQAATGGIKISAIQVGVDPPTAPIMQYYAAETGGIYISDPTYGLETANAITAIIDDCGKTEPTPGTITICKQTEPEGEQQAFSFDLHSDVAAFVVPPLRDNECHTTSADPGEYFVEELIGLLPPGWTIVNIECFYLGHPIGMPFFDGMTGMGFVLLSGADVTCTFTNRLINYIAVGGAVGLLDGAETPTEALGSSSALDATTEIVVVAAAALALAAGGWSSLRRRVR